MLLTFPDQARRWFRAVFVCPRNPSQPLNVFIAALGLAAALQVANFGAAAYDAVRFARTRSDSKLLDVSVGRVPLSLPRNMIRRPLLPRGSVPVLELSLLWPTMEGFNEAAAEAFDSNDRTSNVVNVRLVPSGDAMDPDVRDRLVYTRLLVGPDMAGPSDLTSQSFGSGHGYDGETLYRSADDRHPFIARCSGASTEIPANCTSEFRTAQGIDVSYRFRAHLLSDWRYLDGAVRGTLASFMVER
jgi:hypothetical protein